MTKVAIVYHSGFGHTQLQAESVHAGADGLDGVSAQLFTSAEATENIDALDQYDAIIFGSPTYMGSMSADMKGFFEKAAGKWFTQAWKDKVSGVFTNSTSFSGDKLNTQVGMLINAMQQGMVHVSLGLLPAHNNPDSKKTLVGPGENELNRVGGSLGPMATSMEMAPGDGPSKGDLETARLYGERVATITQQLLRGRQQ